MPAPLDIAALKKAFGNFATGITVVTTRDGAGNPVGITCNSFASVSLNPPLVLFSLAKTAFSLSAFLRADHFGVSVLSAGQEAISIRFATPSADKWAGVAWHAWDRGSPVIAGAVAGFECRKVAVHEGGDHRIFLGEIERMESRPDRRPLVYLRSRYGHFAASEPPEPAPAPAGPTTPAGGERGPC
ncbi:NADH-FMN oxidoreductase RutF, flavin reductase (DIM6/NTAB) family [Tistlia consotensis]|uniref:NADH-FMN oxidoreductase RutF, flavin reductase (DIM6/NTAB) family n=1 Tax=Tistlia consotensis USBA 355 TaxID=560819 RepID=A0A1Y6CQ88_9PROT|nr:flavin reductase family protein [Tistlia consotensis]SMF80849.1 NADH-FMN oxidoreductase RutF, flavin reductase (DIM6/NTAB) family [Tistlia consotensis USBA 355]SNS21877.1 NADH-FMN oxidoreductase RutF, flavin reductase (DIM6/NTAB) family [Tistlia consotensis]